jgi:short-subunit dehydrogenase
MVERKYGRIMAVASALAIATIPTSVVYSATKFGVNGFMTCLYDDLCANDYDEFVKLTTVYPDFINTRKQLVNAFQKISYPVNLLTPERVAKESVDGMLLCKRKVIVSDLKAGMLLLP